MTHRVVIVGGGFGGLNAARELNRASVHVTLIDRRNFHLFQPLLYQVATGGLSPANISAPLRAILKRQRNAKVLLGDVVGVDVKGRRVLLCDAEEPYDTLIVAAGARTHYFGHDDWESLAPGLKSIEDATDIRRRILLAFETAERLKGAPQSMLTFVVVGGGPTGVELAGTLSELAQHTLRREFRHIDTAQARVILLEGESRILPPYPPELSAKAEAALVRLGVSVRTGCFVSDIQPGELTIDCRGGRETICADNIFWAAGVRASSLGKTIAEAAGAELDRAGRIVVEPDCSVPGCPEIFVLGDLAHFEQDGQPLPGVAPVAIQQGRYVARVIEGRLLGSTVRAFRYKDHGMMATIGRGAAVADIGPLHFNGATAWLAWLLVHLVQLIGFENRILVLVQWAWNYVTRNRAARLITGEDLCVQPPDERTDFNVERAGKTQHN